MMLAVTDLTVIENHARIPDTKVQEALGYDDEKDLHAIIRSYQDQREGYGGVFTQTSAKPADLESPGGVYCQTGKKPPAGAPKRARFQALHVKLVSLRLH
jgi:hypothetical protein